MKKHLVLITTTILAGLAITAFSKEGLIYLAAVLMATAVIIALRKFRPGIRITRWAKANPRKTQILITVLQVIILSIGLVVGYDLKQLGYKFNDGAAVVFSLIMVIGFFSVPFLPKKNAAPITLPFVLNRQRIAYTGIIIAAYALAVITGNRVEDKYPNSIVADVLRSIDQRLFSPGNSITDYEQFLLTNPGDNVIRNEAAVFAAFPSTEVSERPSSETTLSKKEAKAKLKEVKKAEKKQKRMLKRVEKYRKAFAAGGSGASVLLIVLLVLAACTGICLVIAGFSGGGAWAVVLGLAVTVASIYGISKVSRRRRELRELQLKEEAKP